MKRVLVIGCSGAGKSTFARQLKALTGLPLFHLDLIWHLPDRTHIPREEFDARLLEILNQETWIIDGDYSRTLETRLQRCDTVFLLDYPLEVCLSGIASRVGKPRADMPWVEQEVDEEFKNWVLDFPNRVLPQTYELLERYREGRDVIVFHSREEAKEYLERVWN